MPASNIQYLNNSPIQFYKNPASDNDKLNGFTTFELTAYDRAQENVCDFITPDFCQYASINDNYHFQFKASTIGSELTQSFFTPILSGTNTSVTSGELVDSGADFSASSVNANDLVVNTTTNESTFALAPIGTTTLDLNEDIFTATPENYEIYDIKVSGAWKYDWSDGFFYIDTPTNLSSISFRGTVNSGSWYKVQFTITNYVAGVLTIKLGDTTVGTISSNGTFTFYDECTGLNPDLNFVTDASFDANLSGIDLYQINQIYRIEIRDLADNLVHTINHTETSDSLNIGNIVIYSDWADSLTEDYCGCYRFWIYDNTNAQLENLVENGTFTGVSPWQYYNSNAGITITGGKLVFNTTGDTSNDGVIQPTANIQTNTTYTVVFTISNYVQGSVFIGVGGVPSAAYAGNGTNTVNITTTGSLSYPGVQILQSGANTTLNVDNITVYVAEEDLPVDGKSECMKVCHPDDCYTLIKWSNDNNSFGFYYTSPKTGGASPYYHQMRVLGRLRNQKINDLEFNPFKNTIGQMGFPYYNGQKVEELAISPMPEYMHNALAIALSHRTVLIDGVPYTRTGGYTPDWGDDSELAKVVVEVAKNNQQYLENRY